MIFGIGTQYFLARYLTQGQYGEFQLMLSWMTLLGFFALNSFNTIVTKSAAQKYEYYFKTANKICFSLSILGSLGLLIIGFFFETNYLTMFILMAIFFPFYSGINLSNDYLIGLSKFEKYFWINVITQFLSATTQIIAVVIFKNTLILLVTLLATISIINFTLTTYFYRKIEQKRDKNKDKENTKYGIRLALLSIVGSISSRIQYIILAAMTSPATLAIYAVAQILPTKIRNIFKGSLNPFSIFLASNKKEKSIKIVKKSIILLLLFGLIVAGISILLLPIAINLIFGQKYLDSIYYSIALTAIIFIVPLNSVLGSLIIYHGYKKFYTKVSLIASGLQIILFILLIPIFHIWGIIMAVILHQIIVTTINTIWFIKLPKSKDANIYLCKNENEINKHKMQINKITNKINGENIIKIIESDYLIKDTYPLWVRIIAFLSFTKSIYLP